MYCKLTIAKGLEKDLRGAQRRLAALVGNTRSVIGDMAQEGGQALALLPTTEALSNDFSVTPSFPDGRFFRPRRIIRGTVLPDKLVRIDNQGSSLITGIATELRRRRHYRGTSYTELPTRKKFTVTVGFSDAGETRRRDVLITHDGTTRLDSDPLYTSPLAERFGLEMSRYPGVVSLDNDYSQAYTGAIVVAEFVADTLSRVHGIESTRRGELRELRAAWQQVGDEHPMYQDVALLLPKTEETR